MDLTKVFGQAKYILSEYLGDNPNLGKYQIIIHTAAWKGIQTVSQINGGSFKVWKPSGNDMYEAVWDHTGGIDTFRLGEIMMKGHVFYLTLG